jgi:hypothetical protein
MDRMPEACQCKRGLESAVITRRHGFADVLHVPGRQVPGFGDGFTNGRDVAMNPVDILEHMRQPAQGESPPLVDRAETATVPGAVAGHTDQEAVRLTGGTDRPLLETLVVVFL